MKYTPCQELAKEALHIFLLNPESKVMILSAAQGRGKSFLLNNELKNTREINEYARLLDVPEVQGVQIAAMSNKAAQVIGGTTFDSLYGLFPKPDFKTGKMYRTRQGGGGKPQKDQVVVIDEASMLDSNGLKHMEELSHGCKIILSCDQYQLGPVGEANSPIFDKGYEVTEMTTPVRQEEGSPLLALCDSLRNGVRDGVLLPLIESDQVQYITDAQAEHFFTHMTPNDKVLTYTNDLAVKLNQTVRGYKGVDGFWKVGETLVSNGLLKKGRDIAVKNEQVLTVLAVGDLQLNQYGMECINVGTEAGYFLVPVDTTELPRQLKKLARIKDWGTYYAMRDSVPDFRGTWASTVHKSQGSTYDNVFINLNNLKKAYWQDKNLFLRLLYVAVSRAKGMVYLYGSL